MRRHIYYCQWTEQHPDRDYAHPDGYLVVLAADQDTARAAVTELAGAEGWEFLGPVVPEAKDCPLGMLALLAVSDGDAQLWVDDMNGRLVPTEPVGAPC